MHYLNLLLALGFGTFASSSVVQRSNSLNNYASYSSKSSGFKSSSKDSFCQNTPTSRNCWGNGLDINTDTSSTWPNTGRVVDVSGQ